jgi:hypothetical protein
MEAARRQKYRSLEYWKPIEPFVSYTAGFWTGFNYEWRGRQNIFEGLDIEDVLEREVLTASGDAQFRGPHRLAKPLARVDAATERQTAPDAARIGSSAAAMLCW